MEVKRGVGLEEEGVNPGRLAPWGEGKALGRQKASDLDGVLDGFVLALFSCPSLFLLFADTR